MTYILFTAQLRAVGCLRRIKLLFFHLNCLPTGPKELETLREIAVRPDRLVTSLSGIFEHSGKLSEVERRQNRQKLGCVPFLCGKNL